MIRLLFLYMFTMASIESLGQQIVLSQTSQLGRLDIREDLYQTRLQELSSGADFKALNTALLTEINSYKIESSAGRADGITSDEGQYLLAKIKNENLYINHSEKYDPEDKLGLCFGRAMQIHLELLRHGVNKNSIKKVYVVGPMIVPGNTWQFHVANLVKDKNTNQWWVLDTNLTKPVVVADWFIYYERFKSDTEYRLFKDPIIDRTKSLRFYITEPKKIGPSGWEYNIRTGGLFDPFYNNYFKDMFTEFKINRIPEEKKFNSHICKKLFN